jgi:hypothetical protein
MTKFIITLTDRNFYSELDLRKEKLGELRYLSYFKIDEKGNVISKETTATFYNISSSLRVINSFLNDNMSINRADNFNSNFISDGTLSKFIKFAKKNGKVVELDSIDTSFLSVLGSFMEEQSIIASQIKELEKTFKAVNYLDSKGRYKRIDYKNIIVKTQTSPYSPNAIYISDDNKNITHIVEGTFTTDMKLKETSITYYSYYSLGRSESFTILKANKKGRDQYLNLMNDLTELNANRVRVVKEYELSLFK